MEKICFQRISQCDIPNKNGIIYTKETFEKMIKEKIEKEGKILVCGYNRDLYHDPLLNTDLTRICSIELSNIFGTVECMEDIEPDKIHVLPSSNFKKEVLYKLKQENFQLGLRYIGDVKFKDGNKFADINQIICYDLLPKSEYNQPEF